MKRSKIIPTGEKSLKHLCIWQIIRSFAPLSRNRCQDTKREAWYVAL